MNTQNNTEEIPKSNSNSNELLKRKPIEGTPFWVVGNEDEGYFGVMGKYKITETLQTPEEVELYIVVNNWEIIMKMIGIIAEDILKLKEEQTQKENEESYEKQNGL